MPSSRRSIKPVRYEESESDDPLTAPPRSHSKGKRKTSHSSPKKRIVSVGRLTQEEDDQLDVSETDQEQYEEEEEEKEEEPIRPPSRKTRTTTRSKKTTAFIKVISDDEAEGMLRNSTQSRSTARKRTSQGFASKQERGRTSSSGEPPQSRKRSRAPSEDSEKQEVEEDELASGDEEGQEGTQQERINDYARQARTIDKHWPI